MNPQGEELRITLGGEGEGPAYLEPVTALRLLLSAAVHEGRSTLHSVGIHAELLRMTAEGSSPDVGGKVQRSVGAIERALGTLTGVFERCVAMGEGLDPGENPLQSDLRTVLRECVEHCLPRAKEEGVALECKVAAEVGEGDERLMVRLPRSQLAEALHQVIWNGVEATPAGTAVRVVLALHSADGPAFSVTVCDEGAGLDPHVRSTAFRVGVTTKSGRHGLGLPLVKQIVSEIGGEVFLEDGPQGEGGEARCERAGRGVRAVMVLPRNA